MLIIGALAALAAIPKAVWIAVGTLAVIGVAAFVYRQSKKSLGSSAAVQDDVPPIQATIATARAVASAPNRPSPASVPAPSGQFVEDGVPVVMARAPNRLPIAPARRFVEDAAPVSAVAVPQVASPSFRVPSAPMGFGAATWVPVRQPVIVAGVTIPGGMVYVGTSLKTALGDNDPCLIDPSKSVAVRGDYTERQMGYWPSYAEISPSARRAYLNWLAGGREDPDADIGYVFLYFYGLERRAIIDAAKDKDEAARADLSAIAQEIRRLVAVYSDKSNSFRRYANELLDWVSLADNPLKLYERPVPSFTKTFELPLYVRLALGQAALNHAPLPAPLALAWVKLDPAVYLRTPAMRCGEQFTQLFFCKYAEAFGAGLALPCNRTKLKFVYRPASSGFRGYSELSMTFGDTPDVTVLTAPRKQLQKLVEVATKELEPFSRFVGKNPDGKSSLEGVLLLPATLWPESALRSVQALKARVAGGTVATLFHELLASLDSKSILTKDRTLALARELESMHIGFEPDVLSGAKPPKPDDAVVLFGLVQGEATARSGPKYQAAVLTLQLASAIASADGEFSDKEIGHLRDQIESWIHLAPGQRRRLMAHVRLLMSTPVTLTSLKRKLEPLDAAARESIAAFLATVAHSDGTVSPAEIKMLEKVYKALGVDPKKVFSDVHAVASGTKPTPAAMGAARDAGFTLDRARIAALQQDTEKVSALLASIFKEDEVTTAIAPEPDDDTETAESPTGILGLDEVHTALARMLLSRPEWSRDELLAVAADLDLMLDGALERINEASFDAHDMALVEGEDPVTVSAEILEKINS